MPSKADTDTSGRAEVATIEQPSARLGLEILGRLGISGPPDSPELVGRAAASVYFLRIAALGANVSDEVVGFLRGEPQPDDSDVGSGIVRTVLHLNERIKPSTTTGELLGMLAVYARDTVNSERTVTPAGPRRAVWMQRQIDRIYATTLTTNAVSRRRPKAPRLAPAATAGLPADKTVDDETPKSAEPDIAEQPARRPAKKAAKATRTSAGPAKAAVPKRDSPLPSLRRRRSPDYESERFAATVPLRIEAPGTINQFEDLPPEYRALSSSEVLDCLVMATVLDVGQRIAITSYLNGRDDTDQQVQLALGLDVLNNHFAAYRDALTPELKDHPGFLLGWNVARRVLGIDTPRAESLAMVASEMAGGDYAKINDVLTTVMRRVLHFALANDQPAAHHIFAAVKAVSALRGAA